MKVWLILMSDWNPRDEWVAVPAREIEALRDQVERMRIALEQIRDTPNILSLCEPVWVIAEEATARRQ
jgi:hypothetical protein